LVFYSSVITKMHGPINIKCITRYSVSYNLNPLNQPYTGMAQKKNDSNDYIYIYTYIHTYICGSGSSVGIGTGYGLDGPWIESRWGRDFPPVQTCSGALATSYTMGNGSFPGIKSDQGATLTPHPLLVPWSKKSRAIPLLPLWAVRPVQSLSACTRVHFYIYIYIYIYTHIYIYRGRERERKRE